jgi:hypothetical protein
VQRWRLVFSRGRVGVNVQQREQLAGWEQALTASGLPVAGLDLPVPRPRFAIAAPLAGATVGEAELADMWLVERLPRWRVREALEGGLPADHRLVDVFDVWLGEAALPGQVVASVYRVELAAPSPDESALRAAVAAMLAAGSLPRDRRKGESTVRYDLRPFLDALEIVADPGAGLLAIRVTLRHDPEKGIGRPEEVLGELGDRLGSALAPGALIRERLVLGSDRPAVAGGGSGEPGSGRFPTTGDRR